MVSSDNNQWFASLRNKLEEAYLSHNEPWKQSGFSGPEERWVRLRKPITDCVDKSGTFLDIGCANGYLLECLVDWTTERELKITPYGLDLSEKLIELAKIRLPEFKDNFFVGNGLYWNNPMCFDYVRTELVYVPEELERSYVERIMDLYLAPGGKILLTEYRSSRDYMEQPWIDEKLGKWGLKIAESVSGFDKGRELTKVAVIKARKH